MNADFAEGKNTRADGDEPQKRCPVCKVKFTGSECPECGLVV